MTNLKYDCICEICGRVFRSSYAQSKSCPPIKDKKGNIIRDCRSEFLKRSYNKIREIYWPKYYKLHKKEILKKNAAWMKAHPIPPKKKLDKWVPEKLTLIKRCQLRKKQKNQ